MEKTPSQLPGFPAHRGFDELPLNGIMRLNLIFLMAALVWAGAAQSQQTTVLNHFAGDTTGRGTGSFRLSGISEHRVIINYYELAPEREVDRLGAVVSAALNLYIDQSVEVSNDRLKLLRNRKTMMREMDEIVRNAIKYYEYRELEAFRGFSPDVARRIDELASLDFASSEMAGKATDESSRERLRFLFFQQYLNELKLQTIAEVGQFGNGNLLVRTSTENTLVDGATRDSLLSALQGDPDAPLTPVFTEKGMAELELLGIEDKSSIAPVNTSEGRTDDFQERLLAMLERNNSKLDAMQGQIDALREEQTRQWQLMQEERNSQMQAQINDLRNMVMDLIRMNTGGAVASGGNEIMTGPVDRAGTVFNIPAAVNLYFERGTARVSPSGALVLNEVVDILARSPGMRIIITGYADRTGDPVKNLLLSQERAASVRQFLVSSGLEADRFVTRYLGDSRSETASADDRKVVVEFIRQEITAPER